MQPLRGCKKTLLFIFYNWATSTKLKNILVEDA